jgi:hypothetical protein
MRLLDISKPLAVGLLELLWHATSDFAPEGDIGRFSNEAIAEMVGWEGDPDTFVSTLTTCHWLDPCTEHRLIVHHWAKHAPELVKKRVERAKTAFLTAKTPSVQTTADNGRQRQTTAAHRTVTVPVPDLTRPDLTDTVKDGGGQRQTTADNGTDSKAHRPTSTVTVTEKQRAEMLDDISKAVIARDGLTTKARIDQYRVDCLCVTTMLDEALGIDVEEGRAMVAKAKGLTKSIVNKRIAVLTTWWKKRMKESERG